MEYMKSIIKELAAGVPETMRTKADTERNFNISNQMLIKAFAAVNIALLDGNGHCRKPQELLEEISRCIKVDIP